MKTPHHLNNKDSTFNIFRPGKVFETKKREPIIPVGPPLKRKFKSNFKKKQ